MGSENVPPGGKINEEQLIQALKNKGNAACVHTKNISQLVSNLLEIFWGIKFN